MSSSPIPPFSSQETLSTKLFTHPWTITLPSHPGLTFARATPAHIAAWLPVQDGGGEAWDEAAVGEWKERVTKRWEEGNEERRHDGLDVLVLWEGRVVGYGDICPVGGEAGQGQGRASVGIVLEEAVRGRGLGTAGVRVFVQLGWALGLRVHVGTMKGNAAMRGVMRSLGVEGREKIVDIPGRGVVAEVEYEVERDGWRAAEMAVEFGEAFEAVEGRRV